MKNSTNWYAFDILMADELLLQHWVCLAKNLLPSRAVFDHDLFFLQRPRCLYIYTCIGFTDFTIDFSAAAMASSSSNVVGVHYRVGKKIGEGSFGVIFEGTNLLNNQQVAIKFV